MIATVPPALRTVPAGLELEYLLLGDLHELLNDSPGRNRDRWLLATLDLLLVSMPRSRVYLPILPDHREVIRPAGMELPIAFENLQRLRDRIAHRAPCDQICQELIVELGRLFDGTRPTSKAD